MVLLFRFFATLGTESAKYKQKLRNVYSPFVTYSICLFYFSLETTHKMEIDKSWYEPKNLM